MNEIERLQQTIAAIRNLRSAQEAAERFYLVIFGERLREVRLSKGLRQEDVADLSGIGRTSIVNMEGGKQDTTIGTIIRVAVALDVNPGDLLPDVLSQPRQVGSDSTDE